MSKVKIQGHASGSGTLTIGAPNTDSDRTITLPDTTGTLLDENSNLPAANLTGTVADARISALTSSKLTGNLPALNASSLTNIPAANITGTLPAISGANLTGISAGKILQVVFGTTYSAVSTGGTTFTDTGLTANITPSSSSNKVLIMVSQPINFSISTASERYSQIRLMRDSLNITLARQVYDNNDAAFHSYGFVHSIHDLDNPSTTSSITYKTQFMVSAGSCDIYAQYANQNDSQIILMEVEV